MKRPSACKCLNCSGFFLPDYRNVKREKKRHQKFCPKIACQKASRKASQAKWLATPKGRNYFQGNAHVLRMQVWRAKRREKMPEKTSVLQDVCTPEVIALQLDNSSMGVLQDVCKPEVIAPQPDNNSSGVLQDVCAPEVIAPQLDNSSMDVLQDVFLDQHPLIIGLISHFSGALQDHIEIVVKSFHSRGRMILGKGPGIINKTEKEK